MTTPGSDEGFDLESHYLILADGPEARRIEVGSDFWSKVGERGDLDTGRLVGGFRYEKDWESWEVHPDGDEIVALRDRTACVVPRGVWHTAHVLRPAEALHITRGAGTRHRSRSPKSV